MGVSVLVPGIATTVQDTGRPGYYNVGIPPSGSLDQYSSVAANLLVGNSDDAAVLECTYMGPELRFDQPTTVAVTGAELPPRVNGEPRPTWESFTVGAGDLLSFGFLASGARAYIAVSGGLDVPVVLGSRSTYALGALGGLHGGPLVVGDELPITPQRTAERRLVEPTPMMAVLVVWVVLTGSPMLEATSITLAAHMLAAKPETG